MHRLPLELHRFPLFRSERPHPPVLESGLGLIVHLEAEPLLVGDGEDHAPPVKAVTTEHRPGRVVAQVREPVSDPVDPVHLRRRSQAPWSIPARPGLHHPISLTKWTSRSTSRCLSWPWQGFLHGISEPSFDRQSPVHRADDPRRPFQQEPLDPNLIPRSPSDQGFDIHIQAAPISNSPLERREAALPSLDVGFFAEPVFQEDVPPSWSEHPPNLADRSLCLPNAAQRPGAYHAVEPPVLERQFLGGLSTARRYSDG